MSSRAQELESRRLALQARCAEQRAALAQVSDALEHNLRVVDHALDIARRYASLPVVVGLAITLFAFVGRARVLRWVGPALMVVTTVRRITRERQER